MPIGRTPFLSLVAVLMAAPGTAAAGQGLVQAEGEMTL